MSNLALYSQIERLPEHLKKQVMDYVAFLLSQEGKEELEKPEQPKRLNLKSQGNKKSLKAGFLKGSFVMADDFDAPLDDFKEYMQ